MEKIRRGECVTLPVNDSRRAWVQLIYSGADITADVSGDLLSFGYEDNAEGSADTISVSLINRSRKWIGGWMPEKNQQMSATIHGFNGTLACGSFLVDTISGSAPPWTASIGGISMPSDTDFTDVKQSRSWEEATVSEIVSSIAQGYGLSVVFDSSLNPQIPFLEQSEAEDMSFISQVCEDYGLCVKMYSNRVVVYNGPEYERRGAVMTLTESNIKSISYTIKETDTDYTGCTVSYTRQDGETIEYTYRTGADRREKLLKSNQTVESVAQAQLLGQAMVWKKNKEAVTATVELMGNTGLYSTACVQLAGFGALSGKYFVDKVSHSLGGGYKTSLELHKVVGF